MGVNFGQFDAHKDDKFEKMVNNLVRAYATKIERDKEDDKLAKADARYEAEKLTRETGDIYEVNKKVTKAPKPTWNPKTWFASDTTDYKVGPKTDDDGNPIFTQAKKDSLFDRAVATTGMYDSDADGIPDKLTYSNQIAKNMYDDEKTWKEENRLLSTQGYIDRDNIPGPSEGDEFDARYGGTLQGYKNALAIQKLDAETAVSNTNYKKASKSFDSVLDTADGAFFDSILTGDGIDTWIEENNLKALNPDQKVLLKRQAMDKINSRGQAIIKKYQANPEGLKDMSDADRQLYVSYLMHSEKQVVTQDQAPSHLYTKFQQNANLENPDGTVNADMDLSSQLAYQGGQSNNWNQSNAVIPDGKGNTHKFWYKNKGNFEEGDNALVNKFKQVVKDIVSHPSYDSNNGIGITKKGYKHRSGNQMMAITDFEGTDKTHHMYYDNASNKFMVRLNGDYVELDEDAIAEMISEY